MGRKLHGEVLVYRGTRYTWSTKGYWRSTVSGDRHSLTHRIWAEHNGPVPSGHKIFYRDGNRFNVEPGNLVCMNQRTAQKVRMAKLENRELMACYGTYGLLMNRILESLDPEKKRERYRKIWETRRERYGQSGGNTKKQEEYTE